MARITGPLMSLGARGTIGKTLTYASWKGIDYARTRVVPANPRSTAQTKTRDVFSFLQRMWTEAPGIAREPWIAAVRGVQMTALNLLESKNIGVIREEMDLALLVLSPGAAGGIPPTGIVITPGSGQLSIAVTAPAPPAGWTLESAQGVAVRDQDPHLLPIEPVHAAEDTTGPYTVLITGLAHTELYQVGIWLKWTTATGNTAYSTALRDSDTTT